MQQNLPPGLPPEALESFSRLLEFPLDSQQSMQEAVDRYLVQVAEASRRDKMVVDVGLAQAIALALKNLLGYNPASVPTEQQRWIQAATRYFFLDDDSEPDTSSVVGFDDDAAVLNAVAEAVGRSDLVVRIA